MENRYSVTAPRALQQESVPDTMNSVDRPAAHPVRQKDHDYDWVLELVQSEKEGILRLLFRILGCEQDALDAFQDCFCKLAQLKTPPDRCKARAYLYRTATNLAIEMFRARRRRADSWPRLARQMEQEHRLMEEEHRSEEDSSAGPDSTPTPFSELREALSDLPAHLRNVVLLRDLCQMPYEEVGKMLSIDPATARVYRRHAVVRLTELMRTSP